MHTEPVLQLLETTDRPHMLQLRHELSIPEINAGFKIMWYLNLISSRNSHYACQRSHFTPAAIKTLQANFWSWFYQASSHSSFHTNQKFAHPSQVKLHLYCSWKESHHSLPYQVCTVSRAAAVWGDLKNLTNHTILSKTDNRKWQKSCLCCHM